MSTEQRQQLHPYVLRQLKGSGALVAEQIPSQGQWHDFLERISRSYDEIERDRQLNDRAWEVSSAEMQQLYVQLEQTSKSALAGERDRLTTVLNTTKTGLCLIDDRGLVVEINAAAGDFFDLRREAALGKSIHTLLWPHGRRSSIGIAPAELQLAITAHEPLRADLVRLRLSGPEPMTCSIVYTPLAHGDEAQEMGGVLAIHDLTQQHRAEEDLAWRASHDPLTGLLNRTALNRCVDKTLTLSHRMGYVCAVLFIDLDHFKTINDTAGHDAGDTALVEAATRIREAVRTEDVVARIGGDEFVVFLENVAGAEASATVAHRILDAVRAPFRVAGQDMFISASIGLDVSGPEDDANSMLRDADIALYSAKSKGRDRLEVFGRGLRVSVEERVDMDRMLRTAVDDATLTVAYQPIVRLADEQIVGFETLARWPTEDGLIGPDRFIPLAEENGLILPIGKFVLEEALAFAGKIGAGGASNWPDSGTMISVNVSAVQLAHGGYAETLHAQLRAAEIPASALAVELTESTLMSNRDVIRRELLALIDFGVRIAIDDFGTGWSSLSLLQQFPIDCIKIDRSFVCGMNENSDNFAIVQAVIGLARSLGHTVIAEGVELPEEMTALRELGCELGQGYYFGRPTRGDQALDLMRGQTA